MKREADLAELFAAERAVRPAAEVAERGLVRLVEGLAAAPLAAPAAVGATQIGWVAVSKWVLGGLVLGVGGAGAASVLSNAGTPEQRSVVSVSRPARPPQTASVAPRPPTSPVHEPPELVTSSSAQASAPPRRASPASVTPPALGSAEQETFDQELRLIDAAKAELDRGHPHLAKVWLGEHVSRYPAGVFATDREALQVLVACAERPDPALAARFVEAHPTSPLAERLGRACQATNFK